MHPTHEHKSWYLAQLKPNCAQIAVRNLARQGIETFLPLREQTQAKGGKFTTAIRPLFPGYIFVALNTAEGLWRKVNSTYGITKLVSFGAMPTPVPADLVYALQARCDEGAVFREADALKPGDHVQVTKGPFTSALAQIEGSAPDQRVWVLMDVMGRSTRVAVDPGDLRRADS